MNVPLNLKKNNNFLSFQSLLSWWFLQLNMPLFFLRDLHTKAISWSLKFNLTRECCSYFQSFLNCDSASCVQYVWRRVRVRITPLARVCVPVKTHLWIHTTYSVWSQSRPTAISLPLTSLSLSGLLKYSLVWQSNPLQSVRLSLALMLHEQCWY